MKKRWLLAIPIGLIGLGILLVVNNRASAPQPQKISGSYVALGDSVAAGIGIGEYKDASACNRSDAAYAETVATDRNLALTNIACSGATLTAGINGPQTVNELQVPSQLEQLFNRSDSPQLITITIGANDVDWTSLLTKCYTQQCGGEVDQQAISEKLQAVTLNLTQAINTISNHYAADKPRLIVTGYYQLFPESPVANCLDLTGLNATEIAFGRQLQSDINSAIIAAINDSDGKALFADVDFSGHELCTSDSWVQGLADNKPYHPTVSGQQAIARSVLRALEQ